MAYLSIKTGNRSVSLTGLKGFRALLGAGRSEFVTNSLC